MAMVELKNVDPQVTPSVSQLDEAKTQIQALVSSLLNDPSVVNDFSNTGKIFTFVCKNVETMYKTLKESKNIKLTSNEKLQLALYTVSFVAHSESLRSKLSPEVLTQFTKIAENSQQTVEMINMIIEVANQAELFKSMIAESGIFSCCVCWKKSS